MRIISLNSVNHLIFVMVKCGVLFEVRTYQCKYRHNFVKWRNCTSDQRSAATDKLYDRPNVLVPQLSLTRANSASNPLDCPQHSAPLLQVRPSLSCHQRPSERRHSPPCLFCHQLFLVFFFQSCRYSTFSIPLYRTSGWSGQRSRFVFKGSRIKISVRRPSILTGFSLFFSVPAGKIWGSTLN
jgi:hypothetical protein